MELNIHDSFVHDAYNRIYRDIESLDVDRKGSPEEQEKYIFRRLYLKKKKKKEERLSLAIALFPRNLYLTILVCI